MKQNTINPYIYPSPSFANLSKRSLRAQFVEDKIIDTLALQNLLATQVHIDYKPVLVKDSLEESLFSLFLDSDILLGESGIILAEKEKWLKKFKYFTSQNLPISFTIVGYAYKIPILLKTNRVLADMGEMLSLYRLRTLAILIKKIYAPGAHMYVITDGVFGRYNHVSEKNYRDYKRSLDFIVEKMHWNDTISVHELDDMEDDRKDFALLFEEKLTQLKQRYNSGDREMIEKYNGTLSSIKKLININRFNLSLNEQMDVYDESKPPMQVSQKIQNIRNFISTYTYDMTFIYHGYLSLRDDLRYLENLAPGNIRLSVSPKKGRIGIIPISKYCNKFPYHGIPVFHKSKGYFTIEYLIDLQRWNKKVYRYFWDEDREKQPFYYEILA